MAARARFEPVPFAEGGGAVNAQQLASRLSGLIYSERLPASTGKPPGDGPQLTCNHSGDHFYDDDSDAPARG